MLRTARIVFLCATLVLSFLILRSDTWVSGGQASSAHDLAAQWNAEDRGTVLFVAGVALGQEEPALCALRLPSREIDLLLRDHPGVIPWNTEIRPRWGRDSDEVFFSSRPAGNGEVLRLLRSKHLLRQLLPEGVWRHRGTAIEWLIAKDGSGQETLFYPPGVTIYQRASAYGRASHRLYLFLHYKVDYGPPGWQLRVDSTDLPDWARERVQAMASHAQAEWTDLVALDSLGNLEFLRTQETDWDRHLTVSPDERYCACLNDKGIRVLDIHEGTVMEPPFPSGLRPVDLCFSSDGKTLAAIGTAYQKYSEILLCRAPEFTDFKTLGSRRPPSTYRLCWSPDGDWLMVAVASRSGPAVWDLAVVKVSTGEHFTIPRPYTVNGKPDARYYVREGIDWTR